MTTIRLIRQAPADGKPDFFAIVYPGTFQPVGNGDLCAAREAFEAMKPRCSARAVFVDETAEQIVDRIEVFFLNPRDGWAAARFDDQGFQIGEAVCVFHQKDAIIEAKCMAGEAGCHTPIVVFRKDGTRGPTL